MEETLNSLVKAIVFVPLLGMFFASLARENGRECCGNALNVGLLTVVANLFILWRAALKINVAEDGWQVVEKFSWMKSPEIELVFGIDIFSLMLIAAVHLAVLLGIALMWFKKILVGRVSKRVCRVIGVLALFFVLLAGVPALAPDTGEALMGPAMVVVYVTMAAPILIMMLGAFSETAGAARTILSK